MDHSSLQHHHHPEMMGSDESLESMLVHRKTGSEGQRQVEGQEQVEEQDQKKPRPPEEVQKCPRCDSTNTKFCYYNNYSLSQPRYFCKSCRRYWTKGGTLRNVPVGGGCRKNRRSSSSSSSSSASRRSTPDNHLMISTTNHPSSSSSPRPNLFSPYENLHHPQHHHSLLTNDLTLAFARLQKHGGGFDHHGNIPILGNSHFDLFGNSFIDPQSNNASSTTLQHLYYGGLVGDAEHTEGSIVNHHQQMASMQFDHPHYHQNNQEMMSNPSSGSSTPTTIKQEMGENKVLWGLPWQISGNGGEGNYMNAAAGGAGGGGGNNEFGVSLKESWNNVGHVLNPTNWHSLLNSPLM